MARMIVVSRDKKGWKAKRPGNSRASVRFSTQYETIGAANNIADNQRLEVVIKGENGKIRDRISHGNDPRSRKG